MSQSTLEQPQVLVLNGGSSSGKSTLARQLQTVLPGPWLRLGVDTLVAACPPQLFAADGLDLQPDGGVTVGAEFTKIEQYWMAGVARMAYTGGQILIEDNFVSGPRSQARWRSALSDLPVGWIGVRCSAPVATQREQARGDRTAGMAARQADQVHLGIDYDLEVHTDRSSVTENAEFIRRRFFPAND